jgi:hypothetical protein
VVVVVVEEVVEDNGFRSSAECGQWI